MLVIEAPLSIISKAFTGVALATPGPPTNKPIAKIKPTANKPILFTYPPLPFRFDCQNTGCRCRFSPPFFPTQK
jgi:hypothetical protein